MWNYPVSEDLVKKFSKYSKITGAIFMLLGMIGVIYPIFMTLATVSFVSWLMVFGGFIAGYFTYHSDKTHYVGWLKSFILVVIGLMMLFYPMTGIETVGLLLSIYFFTDSFASFSLSHSLHPAKGWIWWLLNAFVSLFIGILFIVGWPLTSMYLIGLLVGFSLFFDGFSLLATGSLFTKVMK